MPDLGALFSPRSVAVIGASPDATIIRGRTLKVLLQHGFAGRIYPVSRSHAVVQGLPAFPSIADLPECPELALLVIPAAAVVAELERCGAAGVKAALILASGFAEDASASGPAMQAKVGDIARKYGMAVCGPNSEGFANLPARFCPTFSPVIEEAQGSLAGEKPGGRIAVVSQSGGIGFAFFDRARPRRVPFSHVITTGNEAALECFDVIEYLLDEQSADVFVLFLETIRNAETFRRVAAKALAAGKPIVAVKIGASEAGRRAAASHTAALVGAAEAYRAMFRRYGIAEAMDIEQGIDIAAVFAACRDRLPRGRRVGIVTASGGAGGWLADACSAAGLEVPELDAQSRKRIDAHIPSYGTSQNPVDCTAQAVRQLGYSGLAGLVVDSERVDSVIVVTSARSSETFERDRENLARLAHESAKPVVLWSYSQPAEASVQIAAEAGLPLLVNLQNCAKAVAALAQYQLRRECREAEGSATFDEARRNVARASLGGADRIVCEYQAAPVLAAYGIGFPPSRLATSLEQALAAASAMGGPVALKIQSPDIAHKNAAGGVRLAVEGRHAVAESYDAVIANARRHSPNAPIRGVLVQAMAPAGIEMIVGVKRDPTFGPMLMLGLGGIHAEALGDTALAPLPLSTAGAQEMIHSLRAASMLEGHDTAALATLMVALATFAAEQCDLVEEVDLNPVIVHAAGNGASVVDALIVQRKEERK